MENYTNKLQMPDIQIPNSNKQIIVYTMHVTMMQPWVHESSPNLLLCCLEFQRD
jgi:hypothetical protein